MEQGLAWAVPLHAWGSYPHKLKLVPRLDRTEQMSKLVVWQPQKTQHPWFLKLAFSTAHLQSYSATQLIYTLSQIMPWTIDFWKALLLSHNCIKNGYFMPAQHPAPPLHKVFTWCQVGWFSKGKKSSVSGICHWFGQRNKDILCKEGNEHGKCKFSLLNLFSILLL